MEETNETKQRFKYMFIVFSLCAEKFQNISPDKNIKCSTDNEKQKEKKKTIAKARNARPVHKQKYRQGC